MAIIQKVQSFNETELKKKEQMQRIVLCALSKAGFFNEAAFYGGTCLRILYGLDRFSEDMDFSLIRKDPAFSLEKYFPAIIDEFRMRGKQVEIIKKDKQSFGKVQSAFLKDNTDTYDIKFQTEKKPKVKIETDYLPPLDFKTEIKTTTGVDSAIIRTFTPECLFAGKMHALLYRQWKTRVKGRDWYDFAWYVNNNIPLSFKHLQTRIKDFNGIDVTKEQFERLLQEKILNLDIEAAKLDVYPFISSKEKLDCWSTDYFINLAKNIQFEQEKQASRQEKILKNYKKFTQSKPLNKKKDGPSI